MAWHSGKPADSDFLSASVRHIRENFAELEPLQPHIAAILDSRIVGMGSNSNGTYVRWENGLEVCFGRRTASWVNNIVLSSFWTFPAAFMDANYVVVFGLGDRPKIAGNIDPYTKTLWLHAFERTASLCQLRIFVNDMSADPGDSAIFDAVA